MQVPVLTHVPAVKSGTVMNNSRNASDSSNKMYVRTYINDILAPTFNAHAIAWWREHAELRRASRS